MISRTRIRIWKTTYSVIRVLFGWLFKRISGFHSGHTKISSRTFLLLGNHNNDLDWAFPVIDTRRHMRFVASANILEGFKGRIIDFLVGPIPRKKGAPAEETTKQIYESLSQGISVAIYPEGNKSWDGRTGYISPRNAEIVKRSGCGLVTYRIDGGYLRSPRWSDEVRKGPVFGAVVREYTPEELENMTEEQVHEAIKRDLYTDAAVFAKEHRYRYPGKQLSKHLESVLYICPECRRISTITSLADSFSCSCGLRGRMNEYGLLESLTDEPLPFDNTASWNAWQRQYLLDNREELLETETPFFSDLHASLFRTEGDKKTLLSEDCSVVYFADRIEAGKQIFPLGSIKRISVFRNRRLFFTTDDGYYELRFPETVSGLKYEALWRVLTGKAYL